MFCTDVFLLYHVTTVKWYGCSILRELHDKLKVSLPLKTNLLSECQLQKVNDQYEKLWEMNTCTFSFSWMQTNISFSTRVQNPFNTYCPQMHLSTMCVLQGTFIPVPLGQHTHIKLTPN